MQALKHVPHLRIAPLINNPVIGNPKLRLRREAGERGCHILAVHRCKIPLHQALQGRRI
jgi:hypothetical protein